MKKKIQIEPIPLNLTKIHLKTHQRKLKRNQIVIP